MRTFTASSFLKICSGVAIVLFALAALFLSVKSAEAKSTAPFSNFKSALPPGSGKYQFVYDSGLDGNNNFYWEMVVFNTETGGYKAFDWDRTAQKWEDMFDNSAALPALP